MSMSVIDLRLEERKKEVENTKNMLAQFKASQRYNPSLEEYLTSLSGKEDDVDFAEKQAEVLQQVLEIIDSRCSVNEDTLKFIQDEKLPAVQNHIEKTFLNGKKPADFAHFLFVQFLPGLQEELTIYKRWKQWLLEINDGHLFENMYGLIYRREEYERENSPKENHTNPNHEYFHYKRMLDLLKPFVSSAYKDFIKIFLNRNKPYIDSDEGFRKLKIYSDLTRNILEVFHKKTSEIDESIAPEEFLKFMKVENEVVNGVFRKTFNNIESQLIAVTNEIKEKDEIFQKRSVEKPVKSLKKETVQEQKNTPKHGQEMLDPKYQFELQKSFFVYFEKCYAMQNYIKIKCKILDEYLAIQKTMQTAKGMLDEETFKKAQLELEAFKQDQMKKLTSWKEGREKRQRITDARIVAFKEYRNEDAVDEKETVESKEIVEKQLLTVYDNIKGTAHEQTLKLIFADEIKEEKERAEAKKLQKNISYRAIENLINALSRNLFSPSKHQGFKLIIFEGGSHFRAHIPNTRKPWPELTTSDNPKRSNSKRYELNLKLMSTLNCWKKPTLNQWGISRCIDGFTKAGITPATIKVALTNLQNAQTQKAIKP